MFLDHRTKQILSTICLPDGMIKALDFALVWVHQFRTKRAAVMKVTNTNGRSLIYVLGVSSNR